MRLPNLLSYTASAWHRTQPPRELNAAALPRHMSASHDCHAKAVIYTTETTTSLTARRYWPAPNTRHAPPNLYRYPLFC